MEKHEKDKIRALLPQLIRVVDCNVLLIAHLKATNTIGIADEHHLNTLSNKLERSEALLNFLCTRKNGYKFLIEGLRETCQSGALEILNKPIDVAFTENENDSLSLNYFSQMQNPLPGSNDSIPTFKKVPFQTKEAIELFTGRSSELKTLLDSLLPDGGTASIIGIGGIGKTELAKMFLHKLEKEYENIFKQIIWINCESSSTASTDFINVAKDDLKVVVSGSSGQPRNISSILHDVFEKLKKSKSLIILDNVETRDILQTYMRTATKMGKLSILVTSQTLNPKTNIMLGALDLKGAADFVKKGLDLHDSLSQNFENGISDLVVRLEMLPLAISQAIGYIKEKREMHKDYEPRDYLLDLDRIPERLLNKECQFDLSSNGKTIYKTLTLALSKIKQCKSSGLLASKILSIVAFMAPDNIPSTFFLKIVENDINAIEEAIVLMSRFSIVKFTSVNKTKAVYFSIHRLVQDVLRITIAEKNETKNSLRSTMDFISLNLNYELIEHALEAWKHVTKIQFLVKLFHEFPFFLTLELHNFGRLSDAYDFSTSAIISLKQNLTVIELGRMIFWLKSLNSYLLSVQGQFDDSLKKFHTTLIEAKKCFPVGDSIIFKIRYYIATIFCDSGKYDKAALIFDKLYRDYKLYNNGSLRILYDLGCLQKDLKRFENARITFKYILEQLRLTSNKNSRFEFDAKCIYADIHCRLGNFQECMNLHIEIIETHFKDNTIKISNRDRCIIFNNLGFYQRCAGFFDEAHESYQKALKEMNEQQKESEWAFILCTTCNIAVLMMARNMFDKALPYFIKVYEQMKQMFGENSNETLESLGNIGICYSKIGRHHDAAKILTQLIENECYVLYRWDEAILEKYCLALSLEQIGKLERSIEILDDLRLKCLESPNYSLVTLDLVDSDLKRIHETKK